MIRDDARVARLTSTLAQQRRVLADAAEGQALPAAVNQLSRETGLSCWVLTSTGRLVADAAKALPESHLDEITAAALGASRLPALITATDESAYSVFGVESKARRRLTSWFIVVAGRHDEWGAPVVEAFAELAEIAALDKRRHETGRRAWYDIADAAFGLLADDDAERAEVYLRQIGVDADAQVVVLAAGLGAGKRRRADARWILEDAIAHIADPVVGVGSAGEVLAVVPLASADVRDALQRDFTRALSRVGHGLGRDRLTVGISMEANALSLGGGVRSARFARRLAVRTDLPVEVVCGRDVKTAALLLDCVPDGLRTRFADGVLGAVLDYDARGAGDLVPTLEAFFGCDGSWSRTAQRLGLHINTVRYRIARVEQLTGRSITQTDGRMDLYAALVLLRPSD